MAKFIDELESRRPPDDENADVVIQETKLRVAFLKNYIISLNNAIADNEINASVIDQLDVGKFVGVVLLGNSSERIAG